MDDEDDYELASKRPLKLGLNKAVKKKSKKTKVKEDPIATASQSSPEPQIIVTKATKAELEFKSRQGKIAESRILKKASKTHKQRVEEFNKHLDSLSEHYDIPKVSWTK